MTTPTIRATATAGTTRPADRPADLADLAGRLAQTPDQWLDRVRLNAERRWYERLRRDDAHEIWLIRPRGASG